MLYKDPKTAQSTVRNVYDSPPIGSLIPIQLATCMFVRALYAILQPSGGMIVQPTSNTT